MRDFFGRLESQLAERGCLAASVAGAAWDDTNAVVAVNGTVRSPTAWLAELPPGSVVVELVYTEGAGLSCSLGELGTERWFRFGIHAPLAPPLVMGVSLVVHRAGQAVECLRAWEWRTNSKAADVSSASLFRGAPTAVAAALERLTRADVSYPHLRSAVPDRRNPGAFLWTRLRHAVHFVLQTVLVRFRRSGPVQWTIGIGSAQDAVWERPDGIAWITPPADRFYADPFLYRAGDQTYLFYEELLYADWVGYLCVAPVAADGRVAIDERAVVLQPDHHCSFPQVIESETGRYLLIEEMTTGTVRLYRATDFPTAFAPDVTLIPGLAVVDPVLLQHDGTWFLFVTHAAGDNTDNNLHLYTATTLFGPYVPHPESPIRLGLDGSRMAGPIVRAADSLYRFGQDCTASYGAGIRVFRIDVLSPSAYAESLVESWWPDARWPFSEGLHTRSSAGDLVAVDAARTLLPTG